MNRCRHDIIMDILVSISKGKRRLTEICIASNLPLDRGKSVLNDMIKRGLISMKDGNFNILPKGYSWMEIYRILEEKS
ncbi:winged helix-turn-helix domain-containing protein [Sulfuracidifex metallicus]|uniref:winged helix-turn-helix domain-containing protein n=1 Tax=Sulfuracidifex metallicus TaxID=47303 RepID=UPI002273F34B|nr:winged helix-turn-helix domain-containing protein [Sulfuracidifex metallicus]MCY0850096.1 hypothetical protein [Sulfuracidifex metallicus]